MSENAAKMENEGLRKRDTGSLGAGVIVYTLHGSIESLTFETAFASVSDSFKPTKLSTTILQSAPAMDDSRTSGRKFTENIRRTCNLAALALAILRTIRIFQSSRIYWPRNRRLELGLKSPQHNWRFWSPANSNHTFITGT